MPNVSEVNASLDVAEKLLGVFRNCQSRKMHDALSGDNSATDGSEASMAFERGVKQGWEDASKALSVSLMELQIDDILAATGYDKIENESTDNGDDE